MISSANSSSLSAGAPVLTTAAASATNAGADASSDTTTPDQARQAAKLRQAQSALTTLRGLRSASNSASAGMAKQKLDALKQRLKTLMMFGGDPKEIAREAAQIAKEIGQAAKDYADAMSGGSDAQSAAASASADASAASNQATADATAAAADGAQNPATPATTPAGDAPAVAPLAASPSTAASPSAPGATSDATTPAVLASADPASPTKTAAAPASSASASASSGTHASGPDPVLEEAKQLAAQAKAILKAAIAKAKLQHADPAELQDDQNKMSAAEQAIRDAEKSLGANDPTAGYSADGQAVAAPAAAAPSVSVQA